MKLGRSLSSELIQDEDVDKSPRFCIIIFHARV